MLGRVSLCKQIASRGKKKVCCREQFGQKIGVDLKGCSNGQFRVSVWKEGKANCVQDRLFLRLV